ncbi:MAG: MFS transporter [Trueperaceae bacterium]|nr:MAG: MFS transporter [Trueperaceae bacterium]
MPDRALTVGLVLGVTVMAFGALAVVTVAPRIPAELGGFDRYGWLFSANLLATLVGTVWGGVQADRHGPSRAFLAGLGAVIAGSALAAVAPTIDVVVAGRVLQGLGSGSVVTCIYVAVSVAYPDAARARVLALLSSAWVLPALIGPAAAGAVAELASWRWVFAALVPLAAVVAVLTVPSFLALSARPARRQVEAAPARGTRADRRVLVSLALAFGIGAGLWSVAAAAPAALRWLVAALALSIAIPSLARLTPIGTLRLAPGLASAVAARGLLFAGFISVEVYLALMLTEALGLSSTVTGLVIATGALVWTAGSWTQARLEHMRDAAQPAGWGRTLGLRRDLRVRIGVAVLGLGVATQIVALAFAPTQVVGLEGAAGPGLALLVASIGWALAGLGIGFAHASSSVLAFERAELEGVEAGAVSSALQLSDGVAAASATGVAGALLALLTPQAGLAVGLAAAYGVGAAAVGLSLLAAWRIGAPPTRSSRAAP